jgi:hypothetical protein
MPGNKRGSQAIRLAPVVLALGLLMPLPREPLQALADDPAARAVGPFDAHDDERGQRHFAAGRDMVPDAAYEAVIACLALTAEQRGPSSARSRRPSAPSGT